MVKIKMGTRPISISQAESASDRLADSVVKREGCWGWKGAKNKKGYGHLKVANNLTLAHRLSWILARGEIPPGLCVLHGCDTPECTNPDHLFLGTRDENNKDRDAKGRGAKGTVVSNPGESNPQSKLTDDAVKEIRQRSADGERQRALAKEFDISEAQVSLIVNRKAWGHIA